MTVRERAAAGALLAAAVLLSSCSPGTPQPDPSVPGRPGLVWVGDLETGDLSQFKDTPSNLAGGGPPPEVVSDAAFVRDGRYAVEITIPGVSNGEGITEDSRNELEPDIPAFAEGDELWFGFSTYLAEGFPVQDGFQTVTQWKNSGKGSPPVELSIEGGEFLLSGGYGHPDEIGAFREALAPAETGAWSDWVFHIRFSTDPERGEVEVWKDSEQVLAPFRPETGTMYPGGGEDAPDEPSSYLKTGYYRDAAIATPGTIYFDAWAVGTSRAAVGPAGG